MENKHTPGPWSLGVLRKIYWLDFYGSMKCIVDKVRGGNPEQADANARLIIAAPDLLEAAKLLIAGAESEGWDRARGTDEPRTGIAELRRAIEKAEGVA